MNFKLISNLLCVQDVYIKSFKVALVVGSFLNMINQGNFILSLDFDSINYFKLILTYIVPFIVSSYTAISIQMKFNIGTKALVCTDVTCTSCNKISILLQQNQQIPLCENCGINTNWKAI